jgi:hypothetical protein
MKNLFYNVRIRIDSSGYDDRFVVEEVEAVILHNCIKYTVSNDDLIKAYQHFYPVDIETVSDIQRNAPKYYTFIYDAGTCAGTISTTPDRVRHAIVKLTGNTSGSNACAKKLESELTEAELMAVKSELERINRDHERLGKPVVKIVELEKNNNAN